ncbi:hypothetical protein [Mucilaginibacter sp. SG564]|uniref:hypothetical protein n=1 Tax=Mucilaginibacter sp. SG564 TaxID=2587022 RepID=UPI001557DBDD|nr:hypothetical protein [Mucilaginibacter sp. SG564]NOW94763.1 hypothetical protein [Mucilaginibacter sp. SG564]
MRPRVKSVTLISTSTSNSKRQKRRVNNGNPPEEKLKNDFGIPKQPATNKHYQLSKKALKKLADRKIDYRPFTLVKETLGTEGNYRKLIYNTSRY